jgi:hypothetical protein
MFLEEQPFPFFHLYHFVAFRMEDSKKQLENGMLIISIDVDVARAHANFHFQLDAWWKLWRF